MEGKKKKILMYDNYVCIYYFIILGGNWAVFRLLIEIPS